MFSNSYTNPRSALGSDLRLNAKPSAATLRLIRHCNPRATLGEHLMGSAVRHQIALGRSGGKAAVIAGAAAALLSTGTAIAANLTPAYLPAATTLSHANPDTRRNSDKPRTGSGREPVWLSPGRSTVPGLLVPSKPSLDQLAVR
jgi:hypothetical protein